MAYIGHETVVATVVLCIYLSFYITARLLHETDILLCPFLFGQRIKVHRIGIIPAQVALVDGTGIMFERAVVRTQVGSALQRFGQTHLFSYLIGFEALVHIEQALIVEIFVGGGGAEKVFVYGVLLIYGIDTGPVVCLKHHFGIGPEAERLYQEIRPGFGIAHLCSAQGIEVVERPVAVFGHPEGTVQQFTILVKLQVVVHLSRSFGAGG